jgi:hypothetical protein
LILMDYKKSAYDGVVDVIIESCGSVAIDLDITVYSGSVITVFNYNLSRTLPQDVSLPVELQLGKKSNGTLSIPTDILISGGTLSGGTTITLLDVDYNDLSGVSNLLVGQLSVAYDYVASGTITFDTPIHGGSGSGGSGGFSFGIGLSNLD